MKKMITILLATVLSISSVLANENDMEALLPADELEATLSDTNTYSNNEMGNGSVMDRRDGNDHWNPGYPNSGYPDHWNPGPGYPGHSFPGGPNHSRIVCYAVNGRGMTFDAVGESPRRTQEWAMNECYRSSRSCRPTGCHQVR